MSLLRRKKKCEEERMRAEALEARDVELKRSRLV
jgi:hypothetical protein